MEHSLYHREDVKVNTGKWFWTAAYPWPPVELVLKARVWAHPDYQSLRDRLRTPLKVPEIQVQGDFFTLGPPTESAESTGIAGISREPVAMIHFMPMGKGAPVPAALGELKFQLVVIELKATGAPAVHALLGVQLLAGVTVLVAGRSVYVKQVVAELEQMVDEKVHQGDMLLFQKDANAMPMMSTVVTVAVLRRSPLSFPVCDHSFGIPTHFLNPSQIPNSIHLVGSSWLHNIMPVELVGWWIWQLKIQGPSQWVMVVADDPRLVANLHVRCGMQVGIVFGGMYIAHTNQEAQTAMVRILQKTILDCNNTHFVEWGQGGVQNGAQCQLAGPHPVVGKVEHAMNHCFPIDLSMRARRHEADVEEEEVHEEKPKTKPKAVPKAEKKVKEDKSKKEAPSRESSGEEKKKKKAKKEAEVEEEVSEEEGEYLPVLGSAGAAKVESEEGSEEEEEEIEEIGVPKKAHKPRPGRGLTGLGSRLGKM